MYLGIQYNKDVLYFPCKALPKYLFRLVLVSKYPPLLMVVGNLFKKDIIISSSVRISLPPLSIYTQYSCLCYIFKRLGYIWQGMFTMPPIVRLLGSGPFSGVAG